MTLAWHSSQWLSTHPKPKLVAANLHCQHRGGTTNYLHNVLSSKHACFANAIITFLPVFPVPDSKLGEVGKDKTLLDQMKGRGVSKVRILMVKFTNCVCMYIHLEYWILGKVLILQQCCREWALCFSLVENHLQLTAKITQALSSYVYKSSKMNLWENIPGETSEVRICLWMAGKEKANVESFKSVFKAFKAVSGHRK